MSFSSIIHHDRGLAEGRGRSFVASAMRIATASAHWVARVRENRRVLNELGGMSDYALADLGLTRQDVADTTALPMSRDVGTFLAGRVSERRPRH